LGEEVGVSVVEDVRVEKIEYSIHFGSDLRAIELLQRHQKKKTSERRVWRRRKEIDKSSNPLRIRSCMQFSLLLR
jgi:hypothetical protein